MYIYLACKRRANIYATEYVHLKVDEIYAFANDNYLDTVLINTQWHIHVPVAV